MIVLYIFLCLLGVLLLLVLAACVRAALLRPKTPLAAAPSVDEAQAQKYAGHLAEMIHGETVSSPDVPEEVRHKHFAAYRETLQRCYPLVHEKMQRTLFGDAMLFRWQGKDSARPAVVLMSHSDVVPAEGDWSHPPFAGDIADGQIWGRGAMDTKGSLCAIFEACEALLAEEFMPPCDVYIASSCNEEVMGPGAPDILRYLLDNGVKLALVSDEGGAVLESPLPGLAVHSAMLGIVEKGYANVRFTARSGGGHASTPGKNTPLARLAAFICAVEKHPPFKKKLSKPVKDMFAALAPYMSFPFRLLMGNLWLFGPLVQLVLPAVSAEGGAMLRTTCAFTMASGSAAPNVLPEAASITANLRFIMHQQQAESLAIITSLAKKYGLETEVLYAHDCSPFTDTTGAIYHFMQACVREAFPEAAQAPYIMLGGTDARHFSHHCSCTVRFAPTVLSKAQLHAMHGVDERLSVDALARAVHFYTILLTRYQ